MAFGFFKKSISADLVLTDAKVITLNADTPEASAVACKDNKIIAVGEFDDIEHLINDDTQVIDLEGKYLVPGFISFFDKPVMKSFEGKYADLSACNSTSDLSETLNAWISTHPDAEIYFGYGFHERTFGEGFEDNLEETTKFLDDCCNDRPLVLLAKNNLTCLLNSAGIEFVTQTAEEEMVEYITTPYILNLLIPFDFEELADTIERQIDESISYGITSVLNLDSPEYFETFYQDVLVGLYNEDSLKQRFFGSYYMNRPVITKGLIHHLMNRKNTCIELDDFVNANILYIDLDSANCPLDFTQEMLDYIAEAVCDKGFDIFVKAASSSDLEMAYYSLEHIRSKGYKNIFALQSDAVLDDDFVNELMYSDSAYVLSTDMSFEQISEMADIIGMETKLGSIETGRLADMAVFAQNPFETPQKIKADMIIIDGKIV